MVTTNSPLDVKALAKAELHCHLDGVLDRAMAWDIHRSDPFFPIDPREFERAYPVAGFEDFWNWFSFIKLLNNDLVYIYPILDRHIARLKAQRVRYAEVMIAASFIPQDKVETVEKVRALREWANRQESGELQIEFLVGLGRNKPPEV